MMTMAIMEKLKGIKYTLKDGKTVMAVDLNKV